MANTKEIAKTIRDELKSMKNYKFSVTMESFAGGSSISVVLMKSPIRMIRKMDEIPTNNVAELQGRYKRDQIATMQAKKYHQLSRFQLRENDNHRPDSWNNGVFLTEEGHNELRKIVAIVEKYHRDDSDSSIDYFNCNFYFDLNLGKWDKAFEDGV